MDLNYINTESGPVQKKDLPLVVDESALSAGIKLMLFYTVLIMVLFLLVDFARRSVACSTVTADSFLHDAGASMVRVPAPMSASVVKLFNFNAGLPLSHVVLLLADDTVIDVDLARNYFVRKARLGTNGMIYLIDFGTCMLIKEITLLLNWDEYWAMHAGAALPVTIELHGATKWSHSLALTQKETRLTVFRGEPGAPSMYAPHTAERELIVANDAVFAIRLREQEEDYVGY